MLYEIDIHRKRFDIPVDIQEVYRKLEQAGIEIDKEERRSDLYGGLSGDEQPEYVYITDGRVNEAVTIINSLGYETDEDEEGE